MFTTKITTAKICKELPDVKLINVMPRVVVVNEMVDHVVYVRQGSNLHNMNSKRLEQTCRAMGTSSRSSGGESSLGRERRI